MNQQIKYWLLNLNRDSSHSWPKGVNSKAPHKPILLLSILDGIKEGWILSNEIKLSDELIDRFSEYWDLSIAGDKKTSISLPFFHLKSEDFWTLVYKDLIQERISSPSIKIIRELLSCAKLDQELFNAMADSNERDLIRYFIVNNHFSGGLKDKLYRKFDFYDDVLQYQSELLVMAANDFILDHTNKETKVRQTKTAVRDDAFSRTVRNTYNFTCAVCRGRIVTPKKRTIVDGAHILQRSEYNNDDPRNGLALCKSHHWMYDEYMISIKPDYTLILSNWLKSSQNQIGDFWDLNESNILLPNNSSLYPATEALEIHYKKFINSQ